MALVGSEVEVTAHSRAGPSPRDERDSRSVNRQPCVQTEHTDVADENRAPHRYTHTPHVFLPGTGRP